MTMSNVVYAMPFQETHWVPYTVGVYMAPMPERQEAMPPAVTALYMVRVMEAPDLASADEAELVAEVLRRVLSGTLAPKSRELLEHALTKCESMVP